MPEIANCRKCGKIFSHGFGIPICPDCKALDDENFKRVKEYLYNKPGASLSEVSNELSISIETIKRYLKEGRLEIVGDSANMILECESCGRSIRTGRLCDACSQQLSQEFSSTARNMARRNMTDYDQNRRDVGLLYKKDKKLT